MASFQVAAPEKFDFAKPETWPKWIQRFERFRLASELVEKDEELQVNSLIYTMGQQADDIFVSFDLSAENKKKYKNVKEKFDGHFIVRRNVIFERAQFNRRKQEDHETVDSFITSLYNLSEYCGYNNFRDEMIRDRIVVGIKNSNLSEKMQLDADLTLKRATDMSRQSESVKKQQMILRKESADPNIDAVKSKSYRGNQHFKQKHSSTPSHRKPGCRRCGNRMNHPREKCPAKSAKCFKCSNTGHFAKCCQTSSVGTVMTSEEHNSDGFLGTIDSNSDGAWTVDIQMKNVNLNFKIDTGADVSVISDVDFAKVN